jgi:hypothetical protein
MIMAPVERLAAAFPGLRPFANDVIYVCGRA